MFSFLSFHFELKFEITECSKSQKMPFKGEPFIYFTSIELHAQTFGIFAAIGR